jgi:hypothetical protein
LFHPLSPHLAIYFLVYLSILLFSNSYIGSAESHCALIKCVGSDVHKPEPVGSDVHEPEPVGSDVHERLYRPEPV